MRKNSIGERRATSPQQRRVDDELLDEKADDDGHDVEEQRREDAGAEGERGVEDDGEHRDRRQPHREVDDAHAGVEDLLEDADQHRSLVAFCAQRG